MSDNAPVVDGQGGAAPAAASAAAAPAAAPANTPSLSWLPDADEATIGYIQNKGWQSPADLLKSYQGAEKLIGVRPDQIVRLPSDTSTKEDLDAFYSKLGRPADPKEYGLKVEGADPAFLDAATSKFHELGLNTKQAQELVNWYNSQGQQMTAAQQQAMQQKNIEQQNALKGEWGAAFDQKITQARNFAQQAGIAPETIDQLEKVMGYDGVMKFMADLGGKIGEANFQSGDRTNQFGAMTPAQANAEIKALQGDKEFRAKYLAGNADAKAKMAQLIKWANP